MGEEATFRDGRDLTPDKSGDHCLGTADEHGARHVHVRANVSRDELRQQLLQRSLVARHPACILESSSPVILNSRGPGVEHAGIFFGLRHLYLPALSLTTEPLRRIIVDQQKETDEFHDGELSVYALYNACDGVVLKNGLLDVSKLDEYSPEDAKALNVPRLKQIWLHTRSGCAQCKRIISTLNMVRGTLGEAAEELVEERAEGADVDVIDSMS